MVNRKVDYGSWVIYTFVWGFFAWIFYEGLQIVSNPDDYLFGLVVWLALCQCVVIVLNLSSQYYIVELDNIMNDIMAMDTVYGVDIAAYYKDMSIKQIEDSDLPGEESISIVADSIGIPDNSDLEKYEYDRNLDNIWIDMAVSSGGILHQVS